jgi:hypothetical protein
MNLLKITDQLLKLRNVSFDHDVSKEFNGMVSAFRDRIVVCQDPDEIQGALMQDKYLLIPIELRKGAWEKLLEIGERTPYVLRGYAAHLLIFEESDDSRRAAKELQAEANVIENNSPQQFKE